MAAKKPSSSKKKKTAASSIKSPKTKTSKKNKDTRKVSQNKDRLTTGLNEALVQKATEALMKYHAKQSASNNDLLESDSQIQFQLTLLRTPGSPSRKPIRIMIPHPLFQLKSNNKMESLDEPEVCLIVKEESKPWCQEMIERFPEEMGCIKKVMGLQSLRTKHARYEQRRALLNKYNIFMADDRILPMLSKVLGSDFYKAKKLPVPIALTRKEALPFAIQKALSATYMSISTGTCITIRAGTTAMTAKQLTKNIMAIAQQAVPKVPLKWANIQNIAIKTPDSVALPIYNKTPAVLQEIAAAAGVKIVTKIDTKIDTPEKEDPKDDSLSKESPKSEKKREMKSPLLRALKKQKQDEKKTTQKKRRSMSEDSGSKKLEDSSKKVKKTEEKQGTEPKKKVEKVEESKKTFVASKKFKGSKKGYVFKMGNEGVGYYIDVKPKVDQMAMEALMRAAKSKGSGGKKKGRKGRKSW